MGSIHDETDGVLLTKRLHCLTVQRTVNALSVVQRDVLLARLSAIVKGFTRFLQHLHSLAALRRTSEYQYHAKPHTGLSPCAIYCPFPLPMIFEMSIIMPPLPAIICGILPSHFSIMSSWTIMGDNDAAMVRL